jgi:uncharacterized protein YjbI with pentapeptide repeats
MKIDVKHRYSGELLLSASANDLHGADLREANLSGANLSGANLRGVAAITPLGYPDGWLAYGWRHEGWLSIRVGCRELRLAEARGYWKDKPDRREVMAALDYAEALATLRGWPVTEPKGE